MFQKLRDKASPSMVVAIVAVVFAMSGSAFAAKQMISGRDIQNGSIAASKLSRSAKKALGGKPGKRGPAGTDGQQGFPGPQGPQGTTGERGPQGERGPAGPEGARGIAGPQGQTGRVGPEGRTGQQGTPGQSLVVNGASSGPQVTTATALSADAPLADTDGAELLDGSVALEPGVQYKVEINVEAGNPNGGTGVAYGVARLFVDSSPVTTVTTPAIPQDSSNVAQTSASAIVTGGSTIALRSAVRSDDAAFLDGSVRASVIVTRIG